MTQELIYTSTAMGLKPGSRGFCTVAMTPGMVPRTVTLLESLSGYRHVEAPTGPPHPSNPLAWSHLITNSGDHLLSRVADAGLDYSGRTNKLAHHILIGPQERTAAGPAAAMLEPTNFIRQWSGDSRMIGNRSIASGTSPSGACIDWQQLTGDAGWAAVLASSALDPNINEAYLIFRPNQNLLPLIAQSLSLLTPEQRWQVSFSTYFTGLPPGLRCQWRCVLHGSKEHAAVPPHHRVLRINLTEPLSTAPETPLSQLARTGIARIASSAAIVTFTEPNHVRPTEDGLAALQRDLAIDSSSRAYATTKPLLEPPLDITTPPQLRIQSPTPRRRKTRSFVPLLAIVSMALVASLIGLGYALIQPSILTESTNLVTPSIPSTTAESNDLNDSPESTSSLADDKPMQTSNDPEPSAAPEIKNETQAVTGSEPENRSATTEMTEPTTPNPIPTNRSTDAPVATLVYLLNSEIWRGVQSDRELKQTNARDSQPLAVPLPIDNANDVVVLFKEEHTWKRDEKFVFDPKLNLLRQPAPKEDLLTSDVLIATIEPNKLILERLYLQKLGKQLIWIKNDDHHVLLTLDGAMERTGDSPVPLTQVVTNEGLNLYPLQAICPLLIDDLSIKLVDNQPMQSQTKLFDPSDVQFINRQDKENYWAESQLRIKLMKPTNSENKGLSSFKIEVELTRNWHVPNDAKLKPEDKLKLQGEAENLSRELANQIRTTVEVQSVIQLEERTLTVVVASLRLEVKI